MKFFSKIAGVVVVLALVVVAVSGAVAQDSTVDRAALIQKISGFLQNEAVVKSFAEKGLDTSKIVSKLGSLSDAQLLKLAEQAPSNLSQVGGAVEESGSGQFWAGMGIMTVLLVVLPILIVAMLI